MLNFLKAINSYLSDYILVVLLVGTGLFFTIKTKFVQLRCIREGFKYFFNSIKLKKKENKNSFSSFQALATAIAAQIGTGNIVGVCGAILTGGPGAVFWMWIIAFFGMATIYSEAVLAIETRIKDKDNNILGGPVYYIKKAFPNKFGKFLCVFFAISAMLALGFMGSMVQSNSIGETCSKAFNVPPYFVGIVITIFAALIFIGGIKRIANVTEKLVPLMAFLYIAGSLIVLVLRIRFIPQSFKFIFLYAFKPNSIIGGSLGYALKTAVSQGVKRGLFSNEAGMGSTPHAHALADVKKPHIQGTVAMVGLFIDTFVVLTMTSLVVIATLYADNGILLQGQSIRIFKTNMAQTAFSTIFGNKMGSVFVALCLLFFAFSTIISWNYFGKINAQYLFKKNNVIFYTIFSLLFIFLGFFLSNDTVWELADLFNQLMVIPNVTALIALSSFVVKSSKKEVDN